MRRFGNLVFVLFQMLSVDVWEEGKIVTVIFHNIIPYWFLLIYHEKISSNCRRIFVIFILSSRNKVSLSNPLHFKFSNPWNISCIFDCLTMFTQHSLNQSALILILIFILITFRNRPPRYVGKARLKMHLIP